MRNIFKGLDLINRVPDELWYEVRDTVQETGIKTIPMEKKCNKAKWLSGEALQIAVKRREVKRREVKSKGEKERYKHLNAEFQRIARRDKKAFFSLSLNLAIRSSWSVPQSASGLVFTDYRASPSLAAKNISNLILVLAVW